MSEHTSATGGYLRQTNALPINDDALDNLLQQLVVGVTGMLGNNVRPRWQRPSGDPNTPPTQPAPYIDWCSIGVISQNPHDYPYELHIGDGEGYDLQVAWEGMEVLASFYGPNCRGNAGVMRRGLYVTQNRDSLIPYGIKLKEVGTVTYVPDPVNMQWISRCDVPISFEREIQSIYPILNLKSAQGSLASDVESPPLIDAILVTNPMPV